MCAYVFRDEHYRQLWTEMETFLQTMSSVSKMHGRVYNYLRGDPEIDEENSNDSISIQNESKLVIRRPCIHHSQVNLKRGEIRLYIYIIIFFQNQRF